MSVEKENSTAAVFFYWYSKNVFCFETLPLNRKALNCTEYQHDLKRKRPPFCFLGGYSLKHTSFCRWVKELLLKDKSRLSPESNQPRNAFPFLVTTKTFGLRIQNNRGQMDSFPALKFLVTSLKQKALRKYFAKNSRVIYAYT